jgi:hypothetical protein
MTTGDSALFPTFVFFTYILPRYFGWSDVFAGRPKLAAWWALVQQDAHAKRVSTLTTAQWLIACCSRPRDHILQHCIQTA